METPPLTSRISPLISLAPVVAVSREHDNGAAHTHPVVVTQATQRIGSMTASPSIARPRPRPGNTQQPTQTQQSLQTQQLLQTQQASQPGAGFNPFAVGVVTPALFATPAEEPRATWSNGQAVPDDNLCPPPSVPPRQSGTQSPVSCLSVILNFRNFLNDFIGSEHSCMCGYFFYACGWWAGQPSFTAIDLYLLVVLWFREQTKWMGTRIQRLAIVHQMTPLLVTVAAQ